MSDPELDAVTVPPWLLPDDEAVVWLPLVPVPLPSAPVPDPVPVPLAQAAARPSATKPERRVQARTAPSRCSIVALHKGFLPARGPTVSNEIRPARQLDLGTSLRYRVIRSCRFG